MATFKYKAKNKAGQILTGVLSADSRSAVMDRLSSMGLMPIELKTVNGNVDSKSSRQFRSLWGHGVKKSEIARFMRQLGDLLAAGVPLVRSLTTLANQQTNPVWHDVISQIKSSVTSGSNLADAMAEHKRYFSELQINLVRSGEVSGSLETVLQRIAEFAEKEQALVSKVKTALAYPLLLCMVGIGSVIFLLTFFIPRFATIFKDMGQDLPLPTQILLSLSAWLRIAWPILLILIGLIVYGYRRWVRTTSGRMQVDTIQLKVPVIKSLVTRMAVSRFCRTLATLLKSGIPLLSALKVVQGAAGNAVISKEIMEIAGSIREGQSLAEPLRLSKVFPPSVVEMISVGEEAGNLEEVLFKVAESYDSEVDYAVRVFVSLLEPGMILIMAAIVGFIVVSMLLPVFSLNSMIK